MNQVEDMETKAFILPDVDEVFVKEAWGIVIGSPSYAAQMTPDLHAWMMSSTGNLGFAGKLDVPLRLNSLPTAAERQ